MNTKKNCFLLLTLTLSSIIVHAQKTNITGDTIYVNTETEIQVKFPSDNIDLRWTDLNPPYAVSAGPSSIFLHAKVDNSKCSRLNVFEGPGPRNHSFIICFQKDINKDIYDWSTVKKLQQRVKEIDDRDANKSVAANIPSPNIAIPAAVKTSQGQKATPPPVANTTTADSKTASYYALLEQGDKALKNDLLDDAQAKYEQALQMQPDNDYAKKRLADVKDKKAEKERLAKKEVDDKFNMIKSKANKAFAAKQYDDAIKGYNDALALQPDDVFSKSQVLLIQKYKTEDEEKQKRETERLAKKEQDDKLNAVKAKASKAFDEKRYDDATAAYNELLALNASDATAKSKLETIQKLKEQDLLKEKQERENKDREETFKTIVSNADKAYADKDYDVAKAGYQAAKDLKPADGSLDKKIKLVSDKIQNKENEDEYNTAISAADEAKKAQDYEKATLEYTKASKIFKDRPYPTEQLNEINKVVSNANAAKKAEKDKLAKELENNSKYNSVIEKADKALSKNDYAGAKQSYTEASNIKPDESYPKEKISEIAILIENKDKEKKLKADSAAQIAELNKKYNQALDKGKAAFDKKDYNTAKAAYAQAAELKPDEPEPKDRIGAVEKKMAGTDVDAKYDAALAKGNTALADKNYTEALANYKEAQKSKPLETFVLTQIRAVQDLITRDSIQQAEVQRRVNLKAEEEIRKKRFDEGMTAYTDYETAAQIANYEDQLLNLKHFLNIIPDASELNTYQANAGAKIVFAKKKILAIREYLTRTKGAAYQLEAIPYLNKDLEKKYESINFTAPPDEQSIARLDSTTLADLVTSGKAILAEKPRLDLQDSSANVKLTCQSISFKGDNVFFKLLIQNKDAEEFLTGPMQVSLIKNKTSPIKSKASYISAFPIILPGKEFFVVYVTKDQAVNDADTLSFDLTDRLKKKKLHITIPGSVYNQEKKLKS